MNARPMSERLAPASLPEGFGFFRAVSLCIAFDLLMALLIAAARGVLSWLH